METFTEREIEVVYQLMCGFDNNEISEKLSISGHTTKAHLASIYKKLGVENRMQASIKIYTLFTNHPLTIEDLKTLLKNPVAA